jgi:hypothetical protein
MTSATKTGSNTRPRRNARASRSTAAVVVPTIGATLAAFDATPTPTTIIVDGNQDDNFKSNATGKAEQVPAPNQATRAGNSC